MSETENKDQPFEDIRALIASMPKLDPSRETTVSKNAISLGRGLRPIGRLEAPLALISDWQGTPLPSLLRPLIAVFAGTHGVASQIGYDDIVEASKARIASLTEGRAAVRGVAGELGAAYKVYEFGLEHPSADFTKTASRSDPLEVLRIFGGREIAGLVGAILAARHQRIPIFLDGYVSCSAAAILHAIDPSSIDHCIASHLSAEPAHDALLSRLGLSPVVDLDVNIGDGTGGGLALAVLKAASAGLTSLKA